MKLLDENGIVAAAGSEKGFVPPDGMAVTKISLTVHSPSFGWSILRRCTVFGQRFLMKVNMTAGIPFMVQKLQSRSRAWLYIE